MLLEIQRQHSQEREEKLRRSLERILPQNRLLFDTFGEKDPMKRPSMPLDDSQALTSSRGATNLTKTPKNEPRLFNFAAEEHDSDDTERLSFDNSAYIPQKELSQMMALNLY